MTRAGRLSSILQLQLATDVVSDTGAVSRTWGTVSTIFAEITSPGGSQSYAAAEVQNDQDVDLLIRWAPGIVSSRHRFVYTNLYLSPPVATAFDIVSIADRDGRRRELAVRCKVRFSEGLRGESA